MATTLYFSGTTKLVSNLGGTMDNAAFKAMFPEVKGLKSDGFQMRVARDENGNLLPVTRVIFRKSNPSNHKCDARCRHAKGGNCECSCGGQFHGAAG